MKKMAAVLSGAAAIWTALPGLSALAKGLAVPPNQGTLFGLALTPLGTVVVLLLLLNRAWVLKRSRRYLNAVALSACGVFLIALVAYLALLGRTVIGDDTHGFIYVPLWSSDSLATLVKGAGGIKEVVQHYGTHPVLAAVTTMPSYALAVTTGILLTMYILTFLAPTIAMGVPATYLAHQSDTAGNAVAGASRPVSS